ncbi:Hypothetical predicted protein [Mytilus galloprovincialis]|uniref:Uncharacterized protein n=1 Tax=Mytilus galloprovincialis TaxID=29158 RepID=A0A8B6BW99_MYTGA|nr:Hypothetical predicted protein [Mytilus galloprovincialis]
MQLNQLQPQVPQASQPESRGPKHMGNVTLQRILAQTSDSNVPEAIPVSMCWRTEARSRSDSNAPSTKDSSTAFGCSLDCRENGPDDFVGSQHSQYGGQTLGHVNGQT